MGGGFLLYGVVWVGGGSLNDHEYTFCLFFAGFFVVVGLIGFDVVRSHSHLKRCIVLCEL